MENEMKNKNKYYIEKYTISFLLLGGGDGIERGAHSPSACVERRHAAIDRRFVALRWKGAGKAKRKWKSESSYIIIFHFVFECIL